MDEPRTCGRNYIPEPGAVRRCHLAPGHDGSHETIFRTERLRWPNVAAK